MRMSVTWLDSYLLYRDEDFMSLTELLARLRGESPPSPSMEAGRALHAFLEHAKPAELTSATHDGWTFDFSGLDAFVMLPLVRELKGTMEVQTPHGLVTLAGVVDGLDHQVIDYKLTERFDPDRYMDAMQWRTYLQMFDKPRFTYHVFGGDIDADERMVRVKEYHPLTQYRYPGMEADVREVVCELAELLVKRAPDLAARN